MRKYFLLNLTLMTLSGYCFGAAEISEQTADSNQFENKQTDIMTKQEYERQIRRRGKYRMRIPKTKDHEKTTELNEREIRRQRLVRSIVDGNQLKRYHERKTTLDDMNETSLPENVDKLKRHFIKEKNKHLRRLARLERIRELALEKNNKMLITQVETLLEKEVLRHVQKNRKLRQKLTLIRDPNDTSYLRQEYKEQQKKTGKRMHQ